jgi:hypothetical protein
MRSQGEKQMPTKTMQTTMHALCAAAVALSAVALATPARSQAAAPNLSGTYRCEPEPVSCQARGQTFTVTQTGATLDLKSDKGDEARGTLTSNISISVGGPWNMLGVILPDKRIQWSDGTDWRKQ